MSYLYIIFLPLLILVMGYALKVPKPKSSYDYIRLTSKTLPYLFCYSFLLYYMEMENVIETSWAFYTLLFFLIPIAIIILLLNFYFWLRKNSLKQISIIECKLQQVYMVISIDVKEFFNCRRYNILKHLYQKAHTSSFNKCKLSNLSGEPLLGVFHQQPKSKSIIRYVILKSAEI